MTTQVSPLGKTLSSMGVDALLAAADEQATTPIITIPLACISTSHTLQPRREFDEERIQDLATSIKSMAYYNPSWFDLSALISTRSLLVSVDSKHVNLPNCMKYRVSLRMSVIVKESR